MENYEDLTDVLKSVYRDRLMENYDDVLAALKSACPEHPLLRVFGMLKTETHLRLMENELSKFTVQEETEEAPAAIDGEEAEELTQLHRQQTMLYGERRKLSNSFHDCFNDRQRADVSQRIQVVQAQIEMVRQHINYFKTTGRMFQADDRYPIPKDPYELLALERSLMSSISRKSNQIRQIGLEMLEQKPGADERLQKAEAKIKDLQKHLEHVRKAKTVRNLQPGAVPEG